MLIHVVRHAHAGSRKNWAGLDEDRPLSPRGLRQAQTVSAALRDHPIDTLWSSPYVRCNQTFLPIAEQAGLTVETVPCLAEGGSGKTALDALLAASRDGHVVAACSHGDVIPDIVAEAVRRGAYLDGPQTLSKGARYELRVEQGRVVGIQHFEAPDGKPPGR